MTQDSPSAVAVFVKTPALSPVKTRLAAGIGQSGATRFYELACAAVRAQVSAYCTEHPCVPYWAVAEDGAAAHWSEAAGGDGWRIVQQGQGLLGDRLHAVYSALQARHAHVLLLGADAPLVSAREMRAAAAALATHDCVFAPAHDGGFVLFGGRGPIPSATWTAVSYSTANTLAQLAAACSASKLKEAPRLPTLRDVDDAEDLRALAREMRDMRESALPPLKALAKWLSSHY